MSYTHKKVLWQTCNKVGSSIVDEYGDIVRSKSKEVIVRKQPHEEVITNSEGKTFLTKHIFYVDPKIEPNAFNIKEFDTLDGEMIVKKYEMCGLFNKVKLIRFITV